MPPFGSRERQVVRALPRDCCTKLCCLPRETASDEARVMNTDLMFSSATDLWATPRDFYEGVASRLLEGFNLDPCATKENTTCPIYYTEEVDGLKQPWCLPNGRAAHVFCNPPYGRTIFQWIDKAIVEVAARRADQIAFLCPARTDARWFYRGFQNASAVFFVKGRLRFGASAASAPFPSALLVFGETRHSGVSYITTNGDLCET
jgi:phage N-6-adenine-methyltransferase